MSEDQTNYRFIFEFDLADRMRKALRVSGWSVQRIADCIGVSRNTVSSWLNGRSVPNEDQLYLWSVYTRAPLEWLQRGERPAKD